MRRRDGELRWISGSLVALKPADGAPGLIQASVIDGTEKRQAREREQALLSLEHQVTVRFSQAREPSEALKAAMRAICETERWEAARYVYVDEGRGVLRAGESWSIPDPARERYLRESLTVEYAPGVGLVGHVWQTGEPLWVPDIGNDPRVARPQLAAVTGMRGSVAVPVHADGKTIGVLIFDSREVRKPDERLLRTLAVIGGQIGQLDAPRAGRAGAGGARAPLPRPGRARPRRHPALRPGAAHDLSQPHRQGHQRLRGRGAPGRLADGPGVRGGPAVAAVHRRPAARRARRRRAVSLPRAAQERPAALDRRGVHQPARRAGGRRAGGQLPRHRRADARARGARAQRALLPLADRELGRHHRGRRPRLALHLHEPGAHAHPRLRPAARHRPPVPRLHALRRRRAARRGSARPGAARRGARNAERGAPSRRLDAHPGDDDRAQRRRRQHAGVPDQLARPLRAAARGGAAAQDGRGHRGAAAAGRSRRHHRVRQSRGRGAVRPPGRRAAGLAARVASDRRACGRGADSAARRRAARRRDAVRRGRARRARRAGGVVARPHRAQALREPHRAPREPRRAHRAAEPRAAARPRRAGDRARPAHRQPRGGDVCRPRPVQAGERLVGPPGGRRAAGGGRHPAAKRDARRRHRGAPGRRRVRGAARRPRASRRQRAGGAQDRRRARAADRARRPRDAGHREHRHRHLAGGRRGPRGAAAMRRRGDVPREGRGPQRLPVLQRRDGRAGARAGGARERAAPGPRARGAAPALPAAGRSRLRRGARLRGADALGASGARPGVAGAVHPAGRGERPDRADRRMGAAQRLPRGRGLGRRGPGAHPGRGQSFGAPVPPGLGGRDGARRARRVRAAGGLRSSSRSPRAWLRATSTRW